MASRGELSCSLDGQRSVSSAQHDVHANSAEWMGVSNEAHGMMPIATVPGPADGRGVLPNKGRPTQTEQECFLKSQWPTRDGGAAGGQTWRRAPVRAEARQPRHQADGACAALALQSSCSMTCAVCRQLFTADCLQQSHYRLRRASTAHGCPCVDTAAGRLLAVVQCSTTQTHPAVTRPTTHPQGPVGHGQLIKKVDASPRPLHREDVTRSTTAPAHGLAARLIEATFVLSARWR